MKNKSILFIVVCFLFIFALTGCGKKTAITTSDFVNKSENRNYSITDITSQYAEYDYIKEVSIARSEDGWQVEFYILDDDKQSEGMFNTNKSIFENNKQGVVVENSLNMVNYDVYSLTSNGYYMYLCRVDNTLLYAKVLDEYKEYVKDLAKDLGY